MDIIKSILLKNEKIFCIGLRGIERYNFFRRLLSEDHKRFLPENDIDSQLSYNLVLFPDDIGQGYCEDSSGNLTPLQQSSIDTTMSTVYLPIPRKSIKNKYVYILPPALDYREIAEGIENIFNFDGAEWLSYHDRILWFDSFPYAQIDELNLALQIKRSYLLSDRGTEFTACLIKGSRRFGYSDIENEEAAVIEAERNYSRGGFENSVYIADYGKGIDEAIESFKHKETYKHKVSSIVKEAIKLQYENFNRYFEEDFQEFVMERLTVKILDDICSYNNWNTYKKHTIFDTWLYYLEEEAKGWREALLEFIYDNHLQYISVGDGRAKVEQFVKAEGLLLKNKLLKVRPKEKAVDSHMDEIEYLSYVKELKVLFKKAVDDFVNISLKKDIRGIIEEGFSVWAKVMDLQDAELEAAVSVEY
jgi:hypothetical protein